MAKPEWFTTHNSANQRQKRNLPPDHYDQSCAFDDSWGSYENRRVGYTHLPIVSTTVRQQQYQQRGQPPKMQRQQEQPEHNYAKQQTQQSLPLLYNHNNNSNTNNNRIQSPYRSTNSKNTTSSTTSASPLPPELIKACLDSYHGKSRKPTVDIPPYEYGSLNEEQLLVVSSVLSGYSTFFTGPAGSGKSHVLSSILRLNKEGKIAPTKRIVITATTGIAACSIGGTTIHSFSGAGTGEGPLDTIVARVMSNEYTKKRWREVDILVIDEISMMPAQFLDNLNFIAKRARNDYREFGGLQLVICGDFFQLPPVNLKSGFAFEAKCWPKILQSLVLLKQVFRQNGDAQLMNILNEARVGELSKESVNVLRMKQSFSSANAVEKESGVKPTLLECRNQQVDQANFREMGKLPGEVHTFKAKDRGESKTHENQLKQCSAPEKLSLKVGAQVILLKNLDPEKGLVNGTRGVIVDFQKHPKRLNDMPKEFKRLELPVVQFDSILPPGGAKKAQIDSDNEEENQAEEYDDDDLLKIIEPAEWSNKIGDRVVSSRVQIPLRLAWALSVHKSQGMTIANLTVSLRGVFEYGQAYVALSRATKLDLLTLRGFEERAIRAHPKVKLFYRLLTHGGVKGDGDKEGGDALKTSPKPQCAETITLCTPSPTPPPAAVSMTQEQLTRMKTNRLRALYFRKKGRNS